MGDVLCHDSVFQIVEHVFIEAKKKKRSRRNTHSDLETLNVTLFMSYTHSVFFLFFHIHPGNTSACLISAE